MDSLTSDQPHVRTLTQRDLENFWGSAKDRYSLWNIISPILKGLHLAHERGDIPKVKWNLGGSFVTNEYVAPIFRKVNDKDFKLVVVVPPDSKIAVFDKIKDILEKSLEFLPKDQFEVTRPSYSLQDQDLSFSVCRVFKIGDNKELPLEISIQLVSHPDVRLHVLNLDAVEIVGPDLLSDDEHATYQLRMKNVKDGENIEPELDDIRHHVISSTASLENASGYSRGEWPRYIFSLTDGAVERAQNTNFCFFLGAQSSGSRLPQQIRFWVDQKKDDIPNYECYATINALFHCVSPEERSHVLSQQLEENPQAVAAWMQKNIHILSRLERQIPVLKGILNQFRENPDPRSLLTVLQEHAPEALQVFWGGEDLRPYFVSHLKGLVQDHNLDSRSEFLLKQLDENALFLTEWMKKNLFVLKRLESRIPILRSLISDFEATSDVKALLFALEQYAPNVLKNLAERDELRPNLIRSFYSLVRDKAFQREMQGTWIHFLRSWAEIPMSDSAFLEGIKRFIPLFADEIAFKKHRMQDHLQCMFQNGDERFYILVPVDRPLHECLQILAKEKPFALEALKAAKEGNFSVFANKMLLSQLVTLEQAEALLPCSNITSQKQLIEVLSFLFKLCTSDRLEDFERKFFPLFMPLYSRLSAENKNDVAKNLIRQILAMYSKETFTAFLSRNLSEVVSLAMQGAVDKKPWRTLYVSSVLGSNLEPDIEKSRFFLFLENSLEPVLPQKFPKLISDEKTKSIYYIKRYFLLKEIAPEKAFDALSLALQDSNLTEHLQDLIPLLAEMVDPLHFHEHFTRLFNRQDPTKQLQLLLLQGSLFEHSDLISLYASCYEQSSEAAKEKIESSCLKVVEGFLPKASVHQILRLYKLCFCIPAVASVLEESSHLQAKDLMTFISQLPTPEKRQYLAACTARIPKMPFMKAKDLVRHLPSLGMKQGDLENYLISLYKQDERFIRVIQSDFPHLIEPICNRLRASSELVSYHRFILALRSYGHVQTLARGWQAFVNDFEIMGKTLNKSLVVDLCRQYLPSVSQEELSRFAITCATLKSSTELSISLFHLVVNENFSVNLWKSQPWTAESIQSAWPLMKDKTVQQKKDFVEIAMAILPQTMRYNPIIQQMSLFVSEVSCTVFADKVQEKIVELIKHQNQEEIASYYSFLLSYPEFSSHLSRNASLYTAFLQLSFAYVPLSKKDREGGKRLLRLVELLGEASFDSHVPEEMKSINDAKVKLAFSCLRELKNQNHSFRKIDMNWIVEISLQSLEDPTIKALVQKRGMIHPEFCLAVLGRLIPQLNSHTDTEQTLDLLVDLLDSDCVLSESSLVRLSTYVKEMFSRHESSQALFLCSRRLIAMADYYKNKHVLDELIEEVHIKRLAKALRSGAHDNVLLELTAVSPFLLNPTDIPSIQRMIQGVFQYCLFQMRNNLDLLKLFESAHIASPEMSVFVVDLCHEYMKQPTLQSRPLPIEELTLHLTKASPKAFSMTSFYVKLHELATAFLRQCDSTLYLIPTVTDQMQNVTVSDSCRWQRTIANTSLSLLSKKFIELFLSRNEAEDREKVWQLIRHIHIDRMGVFQHIDSSDLFSDLEAYCLYLENMTPSMLSEALVLSPDGLVGVLNKVMTASVPEAKRFVNRILEIYARHCTRKNENLNTFAMSMGALQIIGTPTLFDLIDPKGKQAIVPLLEFACRCPWGDPDAMLFLKGLEKVTAVSPKSITDDYMIRSLRRVSEHIGAMTSDSDYIIDNATYLIRVVNGVVRSGCNNMRVVRALDEILMQMLVIIKRVLPSSLDLILDQLKAAVPYRDIHSEFAKYYRSHASDATLAILPSKK